MIEKLIQTEELDIFMKKKKSKKLWKNIWREDSKNGKKKEQDQDDNSP